jgi:uncharacterized protein
MGAMKPAREDRMGTEVEALQAAYAALNRGDIDGIVRAFDPQITWIEPAHLGGSGIYRGLEVVREHFTRARANWAEGSCEPERFVLNGDRILVFLNIHVRLKDEAEWREGRHAAAYTFRNGKAVEMRIIEDEQEALAWVGHPG